VLIFHIENKYFTHNQVSSRNQGHKKLTDKNKKHLPNTNVMQTLKLTISGKVHGVFFRATTREKAIELSLKGTVKNQIDGTVEVIVQGPKEKIIELIGFCKQGPEIAEVTNIKIEEINSTKKYDKFRIIH
tara:strand:+ start:1324 stop:1713 length:390 start_codon:yes stop_codon:yes gene_type:complete